MQILIEFCAGGAVDAIMLGKSFVHWRKQKNTIKFWSFFFAPSSSANSFLFHPEASVGFFPSPKLERPFQLCNYCSSDFKEWLARFYCLLFLSFIWSLKKHLTTFSHVWITSINSGCRWILLCGLTHLKQISSPRFVQSYMLVGVRVEFSSASCDWIPSGHHIWC